MDFVGSLKAKIQQSGNKYKIVYPDGAVESCVQAVSMLCEEGVITPIILGNIAQINKTASKNGWSLEGAEIIDPKESLTDEFVETYYALRKHKGIDKAYAKSQMEKVHFYGAMMVEKGLADGMVGGLTSDTKPFIPAFEIVKTKPGIKRASAIFFMAKGDDVKLYSDCAMNMNPDADTLAQIGAASGDTAVAFGFEPNIAFLSFSTLGTAEDPLVDKVSEATKIAKTLRPEYNIDGEMQFDAALLPAVAQKKCPNSPVAGKATVYVFPDLNAGNIGYKITERLGGYAAIGPIFQGLNKPVNDLSRGAKPEDIANSGYLTVVQAMV